MKTEVLDRSKLESDPKIITSARYLSLRRPHPVYLAYVSYPFEPNPSRMKARGISSGQVALTLFQTVFTLFTLTTVKFMYEYFYAHAVALLGAIFCATWFGASYYFEVCLATVLAINRDLGVCCKIPREVGKEDATEER